VVDGYVRTHLLCVVVEGDDLDAVPEAARTGITPILGLFRCPFLRARDGPVTWDDALW
jgi:hypothetical protein